MESHVTHEELIPPENFYLFDDITPLEDISLPEAQADQSLCPENNSLDQTGFALHQLDIADLQAQSMCETGCPVPTVQHDTDDDVSSIGTTSSSLSDEDIKCTIDGSDQFDEESSEEDYEVEENL